MKKGLLLVVFLLAMSSVMAAMSYNKATVTSASNLHIINSESALLSLSGDAHWKWENETDFGRRDKTASLKNGELYFEFGKGRAGTNFGLQPNSIYEWTPMFTFKNNSEETLKVTIRSTGSTGDLDLAKYITFGTATEAQAKANTATWGVMGQPLVLNNVPKAPVLWGLGDHIVSVAVKISLPEGSKIPQALINGVINGTIVVDAEAIASPKTVTP